MMPPLGVDLDTRGGEKLLLHLITLIVSSLPATDFPGANDIGWV